MFLVSYTSLFEENLSVSKFRNSDLSNLAFLHFSVARGPGDNSGTFPIQTSVLCRDFHWSKLAPKYTF